MAGEGDRYVPVGKKDLDDYVDPIVSRLLQRDMPEVIITASGTYISKAVSAALTACRCLKTAGTSIDIVPRIYDEEKPNTGTEGTHYISRMEITLRKSD